MCFFQILPSPPLSPPTLPSSLLQSSFLPTHQPAVVPPPSIAFASATIESLSPSEAKAVLSDVDMLGLGTAMPPVGQGRVVRDVKVEWKTEEEVWGVKHPFGEEREVRRDMADEKDEKESLISEDSSDGGSERTVCGDNAAISSSPSSSAPSRSSASSAPASVVISSASQPNLKPISLPSSFSCTPFANPTPTTHPSVPPPLVTQVATPVVHLRQDPFETTASIRKSRSEAVTPVQAVFSSFDDAAQPGSSSSSSSGGDVTLETVPIDEEVEGGDAVDGEEKRERSTTASSTGSEEEGSFRMGDQVQREDGMGLDLSVDDLELVGDGEVGALRVRSVAEKMGLESDVSSSSFCRHFVLALWRETKH
jgi:hypothetical protein